ncbi:MAG: methionine biosynthesis protein MetW [Pseudonocardia sp.]
MLAGLPALLVTECGREWPMATTRWHAPADSDDRWLLDRCTGPTIDLGCGPGRLVAAQSARGLLCLGVDSSPRAVHECQARGGPVMHRDVFSDLPGEGDWHHVLLAG